MRYLLPISLLALSCSATVSAQQSETRQWFNSIEYNTLENTDLDYDSTQLSSHYYFAPQQNTGVWDDYGYLDTDSNIALHYYESNGHDNFSFNGEGFYGNWFVSAELSDLSNLDNYSVGAGYLFNDSLKASVRMQEFEYGDEIFWFKAQYNHQLNDTDYIGFTIETDDDLDNWNTSSRYFNHLGNDRYFSLDVDYQDSTNALSAMANYYFNRNVAIGAGATDSDLQLEAKYFINSQYYFTANFTDYDSGDLYTVKFVAQF